MSKNSSQIGLDVARFLGAAAISLGVLGCLVLVQNQMGGDWSYKTPTKDENGNIVAEIEYKHVDAPETSRDLGVVSADEWAEIYPEIVASYKKNSDNNYRVSYLDEDQDPYLVTIYEGFGFAKDYTSAIGHEYCLDDVINTERPHALANCLTCKTADYTALVNKMGKDAYSLDFQEVMDGKYGEISENVGCYNCHANDAGDAGKLVVTHDYITDTLDEATLTGVDADILSCGQCHIEYYFAKEDKSTSIPYTNVEEMSPDAILAYYDSIGFSDWTQESTGTGLLKAQHPEMETYLGEGSVHVGLGLSCADCHMEKLTTEKGVAYTSHELVSPLASESIMNDTCAKCHGNSDIKAKVQEIQEAVTTREKAIGADLAAFQKKLAEANASGTYTDDELNAIRKCYREAQWYFDFDYVENAEGAHNSKLANDCLDKAEKLIADGNALFK